MKLGGKTSDVILAIYLTVTLFLRVYLEPQLQGNYLISIALGAFGLLFLWALIKSEILNPNYFGLINK